MFFLKFPKRDPFNSTPFQQKVSKSGFNLDCVRSDSIPQKAEVIIFDCIKEAVCPLTLGNEQPFCKTQMINEVIFTRET